VQKVWNCKGEIGKCFYFHENDKAPIIDDPKKTLKDIENFVGKMETVKTPKIGSIVKVGIANNLFFKKFASLTTNKKKYAIPKGKNFGLIMMKDPLSALQLVNQYSQVPFKVEIYDKSAEPDIKKNYSQFTVEKIMPQIVRQQKSTLKIEPAAYPIFVNQLSVIYNKILIVTCSHFEKIIVQPIAVLKKKNYLPSTFEDKVKEEIASNKRITYISKSSVESFIRNGGVFDCLIFIGDEKVVPEDILQLKKLGKLKKLIVLKSAMNNKTSARLVVKN